MKTHAKNRLCTVGLIALSSGHANAGTGQFTPIGDLAGGAFASKALAISAEGGVVAGLATDGAGQKPVRWTAGGGLQALPLLPGATSGRANGVSGNGQIIVGRSNDHSVRWDGAGAIDLNTFNAGIYSAANAISRDGSTIVGNAYDGQLDTVPYRWSSASATQRLGAASVVTAGSFEGFGAKAVSMDGAVIVGNDHFSMPMAFRWTAAGGIAPLPLPAGYLTPNSSANGCSADGSVIVGRASTNTGMQACRWSGLTIQPLGLLPGGVDSEAMAVSANGTVIVGTANGATEAFYWTAAGGMKRLVDVLAGAPGLSGWTLQAATGVSGDGLSVVGYGVNPAGNTEGFVAKVPSSCYANCDNSTIAPVLNVGDFFCFLNKFASGDPYANCDGSTVPPVLNIADFGCFLNKFAAGCN